MEFKSTHSSADDSMTAMAGAQMDGSLCEEKSHYTLNDIFIHGIHSLFETPDRPELVAAQPLQNNPLVQFDNEADAFVQSPAYRILKFLNTRELCVLARVCRATYFLVTHRTELWRKIDLSSCSPFSTNDELVMGLLGRYPQHVYQVSLRFLTQLTNTTLQFISKNLLNLRKIDLEGCSKKLDDDGLTLLSSLEHITDLSLAGCFKLTTRGIAQLLSGCTSLISVDFSSIPAVNDAVLEALGAHPTLERVKLNGCAAITDSGLRALATGRGQALRSLDLAYCDRISDQGLGLLAPLAHNLEHLSLYCCQKVTDEGVAHILVRCLNLTSLNLSLIPNVTDVTLRRMAFQRHLSSPERPSEATFVAPALRSLTLYGCRQLKDPGFQMLQYCRNLEVLDLFGCINLTRDRAAWILLALKKLRKMNIGGCPLISQQDIIDLSKHFKQVRFSR